MRFWCVRGGRAAVRPPGRVGAVTNVTDWLGRLANDVELEPTSALLRPAGPLAVPRVKAAVARNLGTLKELLENTRPAAQASP